MSVAVLNAYTVKETCRECHNEETQNRPESAEEFAVLLRRSLSIQRHYHYIAARGDPAATKPFLENIDAHLHDLTLTWHTFDLEAMAKKTKAVLGQLRAKREEVASAASKNELENGRQSSQ
jgi:hypothetical protein